MDINFLACEKPPGKQHFVNSYFSYIYDDSNAFITKESLLRNLKFLVPVLRNTKKPVTFHLFPYPVVLATLQFWVEWPLLYKKAGNLIRITDSVDIQHLWIIYGGILRFWDKERVLNNKGKLRG